MKMMSRRLAMPLLGMLLWVISIHAGTFAGATLLPQPITGLRAHPAKEDYNRIDFRPHQFKITGKDLNHSISFGNDVVNRMVRLETNLKWSNVDVKKGTPAHGQLIVSNPEQEALKQGRDAFVASKATQYLMSTFCNKHHLSPADCTKYLSSFSFALTPLASLCQGLQKRCSQEEILSRYRSIDGTCNHKSEGSLGASFSAYKRLLYPDYLDGVQEPRRSVSKQKLPSARKVSAALVKNLVHSDNDLTLAVVQWSEFVEHDLGHTATRKMVHTDSTIECCASSGNHLSPRYIHPFCAPISVPEDDKYYSQIGLDCMTYVRSMPAMRPDCKFGPLEQLNQATHYLDASHIYGSTIKKSLTLRTFEKGQLAVSRHNHKDFLPISSDPSQDCQLDVHSSICFVSGDSRVNVHPQFTALHTLWLREHNRIARELSRLNPHWDDETLFQEARRIVTALIQHITYNEFLPLILGRRYLHKIRKNGAYSEDVDPSVSNSFATASIRVFNSLIDGRVKLYRANRLVNSSLEMKDHFNKPDIVEEVGKFDALVRGMATQSSQKLDFRFAEDISSHLYSNGAYGYDIVSLDIQRGRDHGLPSYSAFRRLCGLPEARTFQDLSDVMTLKVIESLSDVYQHPNDIDLIVGGISERPIGDSIFGPTLSCIIADQFLRTRRGDRYFYANEEQPVPFSRSQIRQIQKMTLARIFCDNGDNIKMMQPNVFRKVTAINNLVDCHSDAIPRLDLKLWMDNRMRYSSA